MKLCCKHGAETTAIARVIINSLASTCTFFDCLGESARLPWAREARAWRMGAERLAEERRTDWRLPVISKVSLHGQHNIAQTTVLYGVRYARFFS